MKNTIKNITLIALTLLVTACDNDTSEKLVLTGSSTVAPLMIEIAHRFEQRNPNSRIDVQTGGSSRGINDIRKGLSDIGMVSRSLISSEQALVGHVIAWDGITTILHQDNPVKTLSRAQTRAIYKGEINNWRQVGGIDADIVVVHKAEGRSTLALFLKYFSLANKNVNADIIVGDNQQGLKTVEGNSLAIGYVSIGAAAYEKINGAGIKLLAIDNIEATLANVEKGLFPIARPLNLVTQKNVSPLAKRFIAFAQSDEVIDLIKQQFFIANHAKK